MNNKIVLFCYIYCFVNIVKGQDEIEEFLKKEIDDGLQNRILVCIIFFS